MMANHLIKLNELIKKDHLWVFNDPAKFDYSDGEASEIYLRKVVSNAKDLTSLSLELESSYPEWDWVSEYHLSPKRANILRGLNLSNMRTVLEVGCGCGAITRYLGEQGLDVESVEGAKRRAQIAQLRCRDLDNVQIINTNFNELTLPVKTYDAIFVVGVIEYAGKFFDSAKGDEEAVVEILKRLNNALTDDGVLIIAIENRNGLKYWMGATEDHFGKPYVGMANYWGQNGIKTYTLKDWELLLDEACYSQKHFQFPFPDYKLPQVVLDERFIDTDEYAYSLLYRIESRDYLKPWKPAGNEFPIWRALHKEGYLKQYANSFLIIAGKAGVDISHITPTDFIYFSGGARKPQYRTVTTKAHGVDEIIKNNMDSKNLISSDDLTQNALRSPYMRGNLLSTLWIESIISGQSNRFNSYLKDYYEYIEQRLKDKKDTAMLDALPPNIIVNMEGKYHLIDQEWKKEEHVTAAYIIFRALLYFGQNNHDLLRPFLKEKNIHSLQGFVSYGFAQLGLDWVSLKNDFIKREEALQFNVSGQTSLAPVRELLMAPVERPCNQIITSTLLWATDNNDYRPLNSKEMTWNADVSTSKLQFFLYSENPITRLRIKPVHTSGFFSIQKMSLTYQKDESKDSIVLSQTETIEDLISKAIVDHAVLTFIKPVGVFYAQSGEATLDFIIDSPGEVTTGKGIYNCTLWMSNVTVYECAWTDEHVQMEKNKFTNQIQDFHNQLAEKDHYALTLNNQINQLQDLRVESHEEKKRNENLTLELSAVKKELENAKSIIKNLSALKALRVLSKTFSGKYGWISESLSTFQKSPEVYETIQRSGLFDAEYYCRQAPDRGAYGDDVLRHYLEIGADRGLNPHRLFNTRYYLSHLPHLAAQRINPFFHYLSSGAYEDKDPCYLFSSKYYLAENPHVAEVGINPLIHYVKEGAQTGSDPHPAFDTKYYLTQHPKAKESHLTPLEHFLTVKESENISPHTIFNPEYYLSNRLDVADANISAFYHYMEKGFNERDSDPRCLFDTKYYYEHHPSLQQQLGNPLTHFVMEGQFEGRGPHPLFDLEYYRGQITGETVVYKDPLSHYIAVGHVKGVNPHPLFDSAFYSRQLESIKMSAPVLIEHYIEVGAVDRIDPHPLFSCGYYLSQFPDTSTDLSDDLMLDYYENGSVNQKDPHPLFDSKYYLSQLRQDENKAQNPLAHYVKKGCEKGISPHPGFDVLFYEEQNQEINGVTEKSPIVHYIYEGSQLEKWPHPFIKQLTFKPKLDLILIVDGPDFRFLPGTILSIMSQLYPRWRLSVIIRNLNTSTGCLKTRAMAEDDHRITIIETDNTSSFSEIANRALKESSGEYVVFLNEHMNLHADAILTFVNALNENPKLALIHSGYSINDDELVSIRRLCTEDETVSTRFYIGPLIIFKRQDIDQLGGFEPWHQRADDNRFLISFIKQIPQNTLASVDKILHFSMYRDPMDFKISKI